jgi:hypothetical protein
MMMDTTSCCVPSSAQQPQPSLYPLSPNTADFDEEPPIQVDQPMDLSSLLVPPPHTTRTAQQQLLAPVAMTFPDGQQQQFQQPQQQTYRGGGGGRSTSILSIGGGGLSMGLRGSIGRASNSGRRSGRNSEATFGRAMSGLSALSIDWENLEDFDLDVDLSAHIQNHQQQRNSIRRAAITTTTTAANGGDGAKETGLGLST